LIVQIFSPSSLNIIALESPALAHIKEDNLEFKIQIQTVVPEKFASNFPLPYFTAL